MSFSLDQFGEVLRLRDAEGLPYILIGGQAVNYWATRYRNEEPKLERWAPFTSKDIDFCGNRDDVKRISVALKAPAQFPHKRMMTAFAGAIPWRIGQQRSSVEFIRSVPKVTTRTVARFAITHAYSGETVRVMDVISLFTCKIHLALSVDQKGRRDGEHVFILFFCTRAFLRETLNGVHAGVLPARGWLGAVERVFRLADSVEGNRAARVIGFNWSDLIALPEIHSSKNPLIARFRERRLPQWLAKMEKRRATKR